MFRRLRYGIPHFQEKVWIAIAWRLPRKLAYWAAVRVMVHATQGPYSNQVVPDLYAMDALKRWDDQWDKQKTPPNPVAV